MLNVEGSTLTAHVETTKKQNDEQAAAGLAHVVDLSAEIETNNFGGVGVTHTGTVGANATLLTRLDVAWEEAATVEPTAAPTEPPVETPVPETPTEDPVEQAGPAVTLEAKPVGGDVDASQASGMPGILKFMIASMAGVVLLAVVAVIYSAVKGRKR